MKKIFLLAALFLCGQSAVHAQCLSQPACPATPPTFCDLSDNDVSLWNTTGLYDPITGSYDLAETPVDLSISVVDSCALSDVQVSFVLFLDLQGGGLRQTAVSSAVLSDQDLVYFGNAANPNYTGGTPQHFDQRMVPENQKYRFALVKTVQDSLVTMRIRWSTGLAPTTYTLPQLPAGTHRIEWRFEGSNGEVKTCSYNFTIKDCKPPQIACLPGLTVSVMPTGMIQLWATDFLQYALDNNTPTSQLKYAVRKSGTGTGFPVDAQGNPATSVVFTCSDLGTQNVELWTIDLAGNASFCETTVLVQNNLGVCESGMPLVVCVAIGSSSNYLEEIAYELQGTHPTLPPFSIYMPASGCAKFDIPFGSDVTVTALKDNNPLNGVSTYDLVLIARHIKNEELLNSPYKLIAADANKSGSITTFDIVELRKLILGYYQEFPNNTSWRFVDQAYVFPNPANPFQTVFPENISIVNYQPGPSRTFAGIKVGDVNQNAIGNLTEPTPGDEALIIPDQALRANEIVEIPVRFAQANAHYGFQFGLHFDPTLVEVLEVIPVLGTADNYGIFPDRITTSWSDAEPLISLPDEPLYRLRIKALRPLQLAAALRLDTGLHAEAYTENDRRSELKLQFAPVEQGGGQQVFAPQPNPTTAGVRLPLRLDQPAAVTFDLLDVTGRLVYQQVQIGVAGAQMLEIPATAFPQAGLYFWRVAVGPNVQAGKIVRQ